MTRDVFFNHVREYWGNRSFPPDHMMRYAIKHHIDLPLTSRPDIFYFSKLHGRTYAAEMQYVIATCSAIRDEVYE